MNPNENIATNINTSTHEIYHSENSNKRSPVYFANLRALTPKDNYIKKLQRLAERIGMLDYAWANKLVAVKTHFGEYGNSAFPRPNFIRPVVDIIKSKGGKPFLAETATLYTGSRSNAIDHIETALRHGFGIEVTGAPIFICDGLTGREHINVKIDGKHFKEVSIASGIYEADALVVISHFKGHEVTGFGGAIKNLGMGCSSRAGKLAMHTSIRPSVLEKKCIRCGRCFEWCSVRAIKFKYDGGPVEIDQRICRGCGECLVSCMSGAIKINWSSDTQAVIEKVVEYAYGACKNKFGSLFFINLLVDIVPLCDCYAFSDAPIVPNIGFLASTDPVAIDAASFELVEKQCGLPNSALKRHINENESKLKNLHPEINSYWQIEYANNIKLGNKNYELVSID